VKCFQGLAYQLVDDALDFTGTQASLGKPALSDLGQGIVTAPILFALNEHPQMYDLIKRKFRKADDINLVILSSLPWILCLYFLCSIQRSLLRGVLCKV
jgi:geranylgeranyl pyrophosphate synthase